MSTQSEASEVVDSSASVIDDETLDRLMDKIDADGLELLGRGRPQPRRRDPGVTFRGSGCARP